MPCDALLVSYLQESHQPLDQENDEHGPSIHCRVLPNNHWWLQRGLRDLQERSDMKAMLKPKSFLHQYAFLQYCLYEGLLHPLFAHRNDADQVCVLLLRELLQMLQVAGHQEFRPWLGVL